MKLPSLGTPEHKHLVDYVCLLRYKTESPSAKSPAFLIELVWLVGFEVGFEGV